MEVDRSWSGADYSELPNVKVKNEWSYISPSPYSFIEQWLIKEIKVEVWQSLKQCHASLHFLCFQTVPFFFVIFPFNFSFFICPSSKPSIFCCLSFVLSFRYVHLLPISLFISPFFSSLRPFIFTFVLWSLSLPVLQYTGKWTKH